VSGAEWGAAPAETWAAAEPDIVPEPMAEPHSADEGTAPGEAEVADTPWQSDATPQTGDAWAEIHAATAPPAPSPGRGAGESSATDTEALADVIAGWEGGIPGQREDADDGGETAEPIAAEYDEAPADSEPADDLETVEPYVESAEAAASIEPAGAMNGDMAALQSAVAASAGESLERAQALLDELRELLPGIVGAAQTAEAPTGLSDQLQAARDGATIDAAQLDELRQLVATAQSRPRDIDVMLSFVGQADTIARLLEVHDDLTGTIDDALEQLRGT
jgi:hypothetical protein